MIPEENNWGCKPLNLKEWKNISFLLPMNCLVSITVNVVDVVDEVVNVVNVVNVHRVLILF